jgi:hypothetical protein
MKNNADGAVGAVGKQVEGFGRAREITTTSDRGITRHAFTPCCRENPRQLSTHLYIHQCRYRGAICPTFGHED